MARSRHAFAVCLALASFAAIATMPRIARACGGCFVPPSSSTVVTGHRMVVSISPDQTVLWDQIQYSGDPAEFAWVLPVARGAKIETSTAAFFEVLEATSLRSIFAPPVNCGGSGFGCSGGGFRGLAASDAGDGGGNEFGGGEPVEVLHSGTVGPYETVTLATDEPGALNQWLIDHNFNVDPTTQPIIDQYVTEGFDFIALRLQPGKGVSQMTPVRVVTQGAGSSLPLRMVAIGTGAETPIVLYVVSEGRYATQNFPEASLPAQLIAWDFETAESNYADLRKEALAAQGGRAFLTAYAAKGPIFNEQFDPNFQSSGSLMSLYMSQLLSNAETDRLCVPETPRSNGRIVNPCPEGVPFDSPECGDVKSDEIDVRTLRCDGADDFATALVGMHPDDVWVTRLEANLPREALDADLTLKAADKQEPVAADLSAQIAVNPEAACPQNNSSVFSLRKLGEPPKNIPVGQMIGLALVAAGAIFVARRVGPRRKTAVTRRDRYSSTQLR